MSNGADELAVLDDGGAGHECVNIGPTSFLRKFRRFCRKNRLNTAVLGDFGYSSSAYLCSTVSVFSKEDFMR